MDFAAAAEWLDIPEKTLRVYVAARKVPHTRVGRHVRFSQAHLDAIVAAGDTPVAKVPIRDEVAQRRARGRAA
jgi:excisionase family DNA binding protein